MRTLISSLLHAFVILATSLCSFSYIDPPIRNAIVLEVQAPSGRNALSSTMSDSAPVDPPVVATAQLALDPTYDAPPEAPAVTPAEAPCAREPAAIHEAVHTVTHPRASTVQASALGASGPAR